MSLFVYTLQPIDGYVRVELCRRQALVTEQLLHGTQIRPTVQEMCRKRVSENMRTLFCKLRYRTDIFSHDEIYALRINSPAMWREKDCPTIVVAGLPGQQACTRRDVCLQCLSRLAPHGHDAMLGSLPQHLDRAIPEIEIIKIEMDKLTHPDPRTIQQLQHCPVAHPRNGRYFGKRHHLLGR